MPRAHVSAPLPGRGGDGDDPSQWAAWACHGARCAQGAVLAILPVLAMLALRAARGCARVRVAALLPWPPLRAAAAGRRRDEGRPAPSTLAPSRRPGSNKGRPEVPGGRGSAAHGRGQP